MAEQRRRFRRRPRRRRDEDSDSPLTPEGQNRPTEDSSGGTARDQLQQALAPISTSVDLDRDYIPAAAETFGQTFATILKQAEVESARLPRMNAAIEYLEQKLLQPDVLDRLPPDEQLTLLRILTGNASASTVMLMDVAKMITAARTTAAILDGLNQLAGKANERVVSPSR